MIEAIEWDVAKSFFRVVFLAFVLKMTASHFDYTEWLVVGFAAITEGAFLYWEYR